MGFPVLAVVAQTRNWRCRETAKGEFVASQSPVYSQRSGDIGSIHKARRAGRIQVIAATKISMDVLASRTILVVRVTRHPPCTDSFRSEYESHSCPDAARQGCHGR